MKAKKFLEISKRIEENGKILCNTPECKTVRWGRLIFENGERPFGCNRGMYFILWTRDNVHELDGSRVVTLKKKMLMKPYRIL